MEKELEVEILPGENNSAFLQFKIIAIGNSGVGKSSLLLNATKGVFNQTYHPTIGFDFFSVSVRIDSKVIKLNLWDTCGQEEYSALIHNYYKNSSLAIVVYAINDLRSFERVSSWVNELKKYASPDVKLFLIGNKSDLNDQRVVTYEIGEKLAKELEFNFFIETSAQSGLNTKELIVKVTKLLYIEYKKLLSSQNLNLLSNSMMSNLYKNQLKLLNGKNENRDKKCC